MRPRLLIFFSTPYNTILNCKAAKIYKVYKTEWLIKIIPRAMKQTVHSWLATLLCPCFVAIRAVKSRNVRRLVRFIEDGK